MIIDGCTNQMSLTPCWLCIASRDTNANASSSDNLIQAGLTYNKGIKTCDSFCLDCASEWQTCLVAGTALLMKLTIILQITIPYGIVIWRVLFSAYAPTMLGLCVKFQIKLGKTWNFLCNQCMFPWNLFILKILILLWEGNDFLQHTDTNVRWLALIMFCALHVI